MKRNKTRKGKAANPLPPVLAAVDRAAAKGKSHAVTLAHVVCSSCNFSGVAPVLAKKACACPQCGGKKTRVAHNDTLTLTASEVSKELEYLGTCPSCKAEHRADANYAALVRSSDKPFHCVTCSTEMEVQDGAEDPEQDVPDDAYEGDIEDASAEDLAQQDAGLMGGEEGDDEDGEDDAPEGDEEDPEGESDDSLDPEDDEAGVASDDGEDEEGGAAQYMSGDDDMGDEESSPEYARLLGFLSKQQSQQLDVLDSKLEKGTKALQAAARKMADAINADVASGKTTQAQAKKAIARIGAKTRKEISALVKSISDQRSAMIKAFLTAEDPASLHSGEVLSSLRRVYATDLIMDDEEPDEDQGGAEGQTDQNAEEDAASEDVGEDGMPKPDAPPAKKPDTAAQANVDDVPGIATAKVNLLTQAVSAKKAPVATYAHVIEATVAGVPRYMLMADNVVVATFDKSKASPAMQLRFTSSAALQKAFFNVIASDDKIPQAAAESFGLSPVTVDVPIDSAVQIRVQEETAKEKAKLTEMAANLNREFAMSIDTALAAVLKGVLPVPPAQDITASFAQKLERIGVRDAATVVAQTFDESAGAFFDAVLAHAEDLIQKPKAIQEDFRNVVEKASSRVEPSTLLARVRKGGTPLDSDVRHTETSHLRHVSNSQGQRPTTALRTGARLPVTIV